MSLAGEALERFVQQADESTSAHSMLAALMVEWGGPAGLARELRQDYVTLAPGHPARVKLQTLIVQALLKFGDEGDGYDDDAEAVEARMMEIARQVNESG